MPTIVRGDFEWDADKAASNLAKHGVSFEEAAPAMTNPFSQDFADGLQPANLVALVWRIVNRLPEHHDAACVYGVRQEVP